MGKFISDDEMKKLEVEAGPRKKFISDEDMNKLEAEAPEKHNRAEAGLMHGIQGAAGGFLDELSGLGEAAGRVAGVKGIGGSFKDVGVSPDGPTLDWDILKEAYAIARDKKRALLAEQSAEHPGTTGAASIAGAVVSPINKVAKGVSLAKGGAAIGGINALGSSDAETAPGMLADAATGAALGGAIGKGVDKASPYISKAAAKVSGAAREGAKRFAARALGAERGTIKSIGFEKVKDAGAQALDEGVLSAFANTDDLASRNAAVKARGGKMMGKAYDAIDEAGASTFNPREVAEKVDDQLAPTWRTPLNKGEVNQFENTIDTILERGPGDIPLKEAQLLKEELGAAANWKNKLQVTAKEQMARDAYRVVSESIDDAVKVGSKAIDKAGLTDTLKKGKDLFSKSSTTEKLLENKLAREQGNKFGFGLTDTIYGAGALGYGGTTGDWESAVGVMAGKKYLEKYGAQQGALVLNKLSKALVKTPKIAKLAENNPKVFQAVALQLGSSAKTNTFNAADYELKGKEKWVVDGFSKVMDSEGMQDPAAIEKLFGNEKGRSLLIQASDLKPGSKAMDALMRKINAHAKGDKS